jgi:hypothetical protein
MKSLIAGLDRQAGKTAYRAYTIKHGIELLEVLIPLTESAAFEAQMKRPLKNRAAVLEVVHAASGTLK